jgi:putative flippase GtrA
VPTGFSRLFFRGPPTLPSTRPRSSMITQDYGSSPERKLHLLTDRTGWIENPTVGPSLPCLLKIAGRLIRFAIVSGGGLAIDFCLFVLLTWIGLPPTIANLISASAATAFVYFMSVSRIFSCDSRFVYELFIAYGVYQAVAILAASYVVGLLAEHMSQPVLGKLVVLPETFTANFAMMSWLTHRRTTIVAEERHV